MLLRREVRRHRMARPEEADWDDARTIRSYATPGTQPTVWSAVTRPSGPGPSERTEGS
jgi:hypothetical protein